MTATETTAAQVPDFGDDDADRKICFICSKGTLDMAYPAPGDGQRRTGRGRWRPTSSSRSGAWT